MECHKGLDATLGPAQTPKDFTKLGFKAGISRLGISHLLFQHWMFKYAYFGYLRWISMNFGGVFLTIVLENMWFSVAHFCINFKLSQKESLPVAIVYVRNSVAWYLFFFWGGGRVCLFRYTVTLYIYLDPIHCSHLHHPFCFCFFFEVQEILSRKNCYWRSREFLSSEIWTAVQLLDKQNPDSE